MYPTLKSEVKVEVGVTLLEALPVSTVEDKVANRIRRAILVGDLPSGTRMRQAEVAQKFGVSITPVRSALRRLENERLVQIEPHRTVVVRTPTREELSEIYEIRLLLEPAAMKRVCRTISESALSDAEAILNLMRGEANIGEWVWLNREFHFTLLRAHPGTHMSDILLNLLSLSAIHIRTSAHWPTERIRQADDEHRELIDACRARDPEKVKRATWRHLHSSMKMKSSGP